MWRAAEIVDVAAGALRGHAGALEAEQAVHGLDALAEVALHPLLAAAFAAAGRGVFVEWPYPGEAGKKRQAGRLPHRAERERCDLVLTPGPGVLVDPVAELKEAEAAEGTLWGNVGCGMSDVGCEEGRSGGPPIRHPISPIRHPTSHIRHRPEDAFWMEVKVVGQFCYTAGVPGPNRTYASELLRLPAGDIAKLAREPRVVHGGVLLVLFTADRRTADHDLNVFAHRCLDRALEVRSPAVERFGIADRIGNGVCTVALVPVRR